MVRVSVIVPVRNAMSFLPTTVPSLIAAARRAGDVELIYVDNGSSDGSLEYLRREPSLRLASAPGVTIGTVRNTGARLGEGEYLSFLDADCSVANSYFLDALAVLQDSGAAATGCEVRAPVDACWIERAWEALHYVGRDRDVHYLNSANFFITRQAFDQVGGFDEELRTGEDAEIGLRLTLGGHRIRESTRVLAIHHGNPKSIREFYRRTVWHGLGMFGTVTRHKLDKPTAMMLLHLALTVAGISALVVRSSLTPAQRLLILVGSQLLVPGVTVLHRMWQTRRVGPLVAGVVLYWFYYWGRLQALMLVIGRRSHIFTK